MVRMNPYNNKRWRSKRAQQLRVAPFCKMCLEMGKYTAATVADHIEPHNGDMQKFWEGELQSLCATHHSSTKQVQEKSGHLVGTDVNGMPLSPQHHWNGGGRGRVDRKAAQAKTAARLFLS